MTKKSIQIEAHRRVKTVLESNEDLIRVTHVDMESDKKHVIVTVATRCVVTQEMKIPKDSLSSWQLIDLMDGYLTGTLH